jgi:hypothetical protein
MARRVLLARFVAAFLLVTALVVLSAYAGDKALTNDDVAALAKSGLSDAAIVALIQRSKTEFDLSPAGLVALRRAGVSNVVVETMLGVRASGENPAATSPSSGTLSLPSAYGYYVLDGSQWRLIKPSPVITRVGIELSPGNGWGVTGLSGEPSLRTATEPVFLIYQHAVDMRALHLTHVEYRDTMTAGQFMEHYDNPYSHPAQEGVFHKKVTDLISIDLWQATVDLPVRLEPVEGKSGMYRVSPEASLTSGRYALYFGEAMLPKGIKASLRLRPDSPTAIYFLADSQGEASSGSPLPAQLPVSAGQQQSSRALQTPPTLPVTPGLSRPPARARETAIVTFTGKRVSIDYGRPDLKGRRLDELMSQLPADRVWRAGENEVTTLTTQTDLLIGGTKVAAGKYSVYVHAPAGWGWSLILNSDPGVPLKRIFPAAPPEKADQMWPVLGGYAKIASKEVLRVPMRLVTPKKPLDQFLIELDPALGGVSAITLTWGDHAWTVDVRDSSTVR